MKDRRNNERDLEIARQGSREALARRRQRERGRRAELAGDLPRGETKKEREKRGQLSRKFCEREGQQENNKKGKIKAEDENYLTLGSTTGFTSESEVRFLQTERRRTEMSSRAFSWRVFFSESRSWGLRAPRFQGRRDGGVKNQLEVRKHV